MRFWVIAMTAAATTIAAAQDAGPPKPGEDEFDWMQFTNGEWLKGEIKDLQDDSFVFESDELDRLKLDFDDIETVISSRRNAVLLRDKTLVEGQLRITADTVTVITEEGEQTFPREEIRSIVPGGRSEANFWSGKVSLGATVLRGNTEQTDVAGFIKIQRRDAISRLNLEYNGAWGEVDGSTTTNNHRALANYDVYVTERLYVRPARITAFSDEFQNIEYRVTPSVGAGYDIIDTSRWDWSVFGGVGWEFTKFSDPQPGAPGEQDSAALIAGTRVSWEATSRIDLGFEFDITMPVPETLDYNMRTALISEIELWQDFDLDVQLVWDRNNNPATLAGGETPLKDDYRLYVGLGWNF